jgi:AcrR family transcriptional regulator
LGQDVDRNPRRSRRERAVPRQVDHQERRAHIAAAVARIAADRGLAGVSFREVAAEAGVSVSLVQHYFGTKDGLLLGTLEIVTGRMAERIFREVAPLGDDAHPRARLRAVAGAFLPTDEESRAAMLVYHGFTAVAITDESLQRADAFRGSEALLDFLAAQLRQADAAGDLAPGADPETEAWILLSLVLGLSLGVLLDQLAADRAGAVLDAHLARLIAGPG